MDTKTIYLLMIIAIIITMFWIVLHTIRIKIFTKRINEEKRQKFKESYSLHFPDDSEADGYQLTIGSCIMFSSWLMLMVIFLSDSAVFTLISIALVIIMCIHIKKPLLTQRKK